MIFFSGVPSGISGSAKVEAAEEDPVVTRLVAEDALCYPFPLRFRGRLPLVPILGGMFYKQLYVRGTFRSFFRDEVFRPGALIPAERIDLHYEFFNGPSARESACACFLSSVTSRPTAKMVPCSAAAVQLIQRQPPSLCR